MTARPKRFKLSAVLGLALAGAALSGCITLFPASQPAQLYRFGYGSGPPQGGARDVGQRTGVLLDSVQLNRAIVSDQIRGVAGNETFYLSGARWEAPANLLFSEAVIRAFDERAQLLRLLPRGGIGKTQASLRLYVRDLEADYGAIALPPPLKPGTKNPPPPNLPAPTASVAVRARLIDGTGQIVAERDFVARQPAGDNRISAIVPAINASVEQVLNEMVVWADANAPAPAAAGR